MADFFNLSTPQDSKDRIMTAISSIIDSHSFILGSQVQELERELCKFTAAAHCITCANGTDALILALLSINIKPGDTVITTPFTFAATAEAIAFVGAVPVFVDIDVDTFNLSPAALKAYLSKTPKYKRPKAIIGVDLFGNPAQWEHINDIANSFGHIITIADAAQSMGASVGEDKVGTLADITCTSFFPTKPLGCFGDGGAVFTDFAGVADKIRSLRVHGSSKEKYHHEAIGMNSRLDTIQAAVLLEKLKTAEEERIVRSRISCIYDVILKKFGFPSQLVLPGSLSAHAIFSFRTPPCRDLLKEKLEQAGIQTAIYYPVPLHKQKAYEFYAPFVPSALSNAELVADSILSISTNTDIGYTSLMDKADTLEQVLSALTKGK